MDRSGGRSQALRRAVTFHQRVRPEPALDEERDDDGAEQEPRLHLGANVTPACAMLTSSHGNLPRKQ